MRKYVFLIILISLTSTVLGQGPGPCFGGAYPKPVCEERCNPCDNSIDCQQCINENPDASVPIDGGLSWLLLAGIGLAGNHLRKKRYGKKSNE